MDDYGIEKIKTIGDSYMCASGLPVKKNSHSVDCCLAALKILYSMEETKKPGNIVDNIDLNNWSIRIGIHTGSCISGVVGVKKHRFDIWGDSVNIASRMQMSGVPGKINISESTYKEVKDFFNCSFRGNMEIKNIGSVGAYFQVYAFTPGAWYYLNPGEKVVVYEDYHTPAIPVTPGYQYCRISILGRKITGERIGAVWTSNEFEIIYV